MNKFLNKMELKWGKYAIERLPMYMLILYAIGYVMLLINPGIRYVISLNPYAILHGQVWRIFTWLLIPPQVITDPSSFVFGILMLYFFYSIGMSMERTWGAFNFNVYIFMGVLITILSSLSMYCFIEIFYSGYSASIDSQQTKILGELTFLDGGSYFYKALEDTYGGFTTYYINMSIFLAFAVTYPDIQVLFMFFVPIKVKILGLLDAALIFIDIYKTFPFGVFMIGGSLVNFLVFFIAYRKRLLGSPQTRARQKQFRRSMREATVRQNVIAKHKCAICGRTSDEYPDLEFRFCSKCAGNYEYCKDHLYTHRHIEKNG